MGDSFQVHVFGDPGMEMMPECSGCMCLNHSKFFLFVNGYTFSTYSLIWCPEGGFWVSFLIVLGALRAVCVALDGFGNRLEFRCI